MPDVRYYNVGIWCTNPDSLARGRDRSIEDRKWKDSAKKHDHTACMFTTQQSSLCNPTRLVNECMRCEPAVKVEYHGVGSRCSTCDRLLMWPIRNGIRTRKPGITYSNVVNISMQRSLHLKRGQAMATQVRDEGNTDILLIEETAVRQNSFAHGSIIQLRRS